MFVPVSGAAAYCPTSHRMHARACGWWISSMRYARRDMIDTGENTSGVVVAMSGGEVRWRLSWTRSLRTTIALATTTSEVRIEGQSKSDVEHCELWAMKFRRTVWTLDKGHEGGEALLCGLRDDARAVADGVHSITHEVVICIFCIMLFIQTVQFTYASNTQLSCERDIR